MIELRVEDHSDPIAELKRLLRLHHVYYLIDEAEEKLTAGDTNLAITTMKKALELNPQSDDAFLELGIMYMKTGQTERAITAFREALRINPRMKVVIRQLAKFEPFKTPKELLEKIGIE